MPHTQINFQPRVVRVALASLNQWTFARMGLTRAMLNPFIEVSPCDFP